MSKMIDSNFLNIHEGKMGRVVKINNSFYFDEFGKTIVIKGTPPSCFGWHEKNGVVCGCEVLYTL